MKITINGQTVCELSEIQKKVIQNDISSDIFESDMIRRLSWTVDHPCSQCHDTNKKSWNDILKSKGVKSAPVEKVALAEEVFKHIPCDLPPDQEKDLSVDIDGREVFKVPPTQKRMLVLHGKKDPDQYCHSQMAWILTHKYERCMERLRREWEPKLTDRGSATLPTDDDEFATLVFSQTDYKNRSQREA